MGCRILVGKGDSGEGVEYAVFYDSVTDVCFGPLMNNLEEAESFEKFLEGHKSKKGSDPRTYDVWDLIELYNKFLEEREEE